jgi:hypothetical protein
VFTTFRRVRRDVSGDGFDDVIIGTISIRTGIFRRQHVVFGRRQACRRTPPSRRLVEEARGDLRQLTPRLPAGPGRLWLCNSLANPKLISAKARVSAIRSRGVLSPVKEVREGFSAADFAKF